MAATVPAGARAPRRLYALRRGDGPRPGRLPPLPAILATGVLASCSGPQSALDPAGTEAMVMADLFWILAIGAVVLWLLVFGLFVYVTRIDRRALPQNLAKGLIIGGGIVFPVTLLTILLVYALSIMPDQRAPGSGLTVRVTGEQWWWRVEYWPDGASEPVVSANEIRLPADRRTEIVLGADKVIHSFWIPSLAGKMDMFPGRATRLALEPRKPGIYRGQCAEFCGESHALMAFQAVVLEADAFERWLERERGPAAAPADDLARTGEAVFFAQGCGACHTVRGTAAGGGIGPDLTRVGSRRSLGAGIMPVSAATLARWVGHTDTIKPGVHMPAYRHLDPDRLAALGHYLEGLK